MLQLLATALIATTPQFTDWEVLETEPVQIKTRTVVGSNEHEIWAEADLRASVSAVEAVILDTSHYPDFMPYVRRAVVIDSRFCSSPEQGYCTYGMMEFPFVGRRDYVVAVTVDRQTGTDGWFANHWESRPWVFPAQIGVKRLLVNSGSWSARPNSDGGTHVVYRVLTDPGGGIPAFLINIGNRSGVHDTLNAIETEAMRRSK